MAEHHVTSEEEGGEIRLKMLEVTLGTLDLRESEIYPSRQQRRKRRRKKEEKKIQNHSGMMYIILIDPAKVLFLKFCIPA